MKQLHFPISVLRLTICALLIASASSNAKTPAKAPENKSSNPSGAVFATSAADGGRLFIGRSPLLGTTETISIMIDGKVAGTLVRGRTFDRFLTPGRHVLIVSSANGSTWQGALEVQRGETYSYTASFNGSKLLLTPMKTSR